MIDFEIQRCTRHCAATARPLEPGEEFYSVLVSEGGNIIRLDYGLDAWQGPPEGAIGCWRSQIPRLDQHKLHWAPNDVMLHLFEQYESDPSQADTRYVLALLLVRRRVMRLEETEHEGTRSEVLVLYCPRNENTYRVRAVLPDDQRADEIQQELGRLLFAKGEGEGK